MNVIEHINFQGNDYDIRDTRSFSTIASFTGAGLSGGDKSQNVSSDMFSYEKGYKNVFIKFVSEAIAIPASTISVIFTLMDNRNITITIPSATGTSVKYWTANFDCIGNNLFFTRYNKSAVNSTSTIAYNAMSVKDGSGITEPYQCYCKKITINGLGAYDHNTSEETNYGTITIYGVPVD